MLGFLLNFSFSADHNAAAAGLVGLAHAVVAIYYTAGGEIRSRDVVHELADFHIRIVEQSHAGVDTLCEVVRRHVGGHTYSDTGGAVDKDIREAGRQHERFFAGVVVVGLEVNGIFIDIPQHFLAKLGKTHLGITHGGRAVAIDGAELAVAVDKGVAQRPPLGHAYYSAVDRRVAVGVIVTHYLAHTFG